MFIADLHALTTGSKSNLRQEALNTAKLILAIAKAEKIDLKRLHLFIQSDNSDHIELMYYLSSLIPLNQLTGMIQFKEKSGESPLTALSLYPLLMAADILLYNPDIIPVGKDQSEHLELTRKIARKLNRKGMSLKIPSTLASDSLKIMSLTDGNKKMSKSDPSDYSRINLLDSQDTIELKIKKAKSGFSLDDNTPELTNLKLIFSLLGSDKLDTDSITEFKKQLAKGIFNELQLIQAEYYNISDQELLDYLEIGLNKAKSISSQTLQEIKKNFN